MDKLAVLKRKLVKRSNRFVKELSDKPPKNEITKARLNATITALRESIDTLNSVNNLTEPETGDVWKDDGTTKYTVDRIARDYETGEDHVMFYQFGETGYKLIPYCNWHHVFTLVAKGKDNGH